jgi:hypothetical protein
VIRLEAGTVESANSDSRRSAGVAPTLHRMTDLKRIKRRRWTVETDRCGARRYGTRPRPRFRFTTTIPPGPGEILHAIRTGSGAVAR